MLKKNKLLIFVVLCSFVCGLFMTNKSLLSKRVFKSTNNTEIVLVENNKVPFEILKLKDRKWYKKLSKTLDKYVRVDNRGKTVVIAGIILIGIFLMVFSAKKSN